MKRYISTILSAFILTAAILPNISHAQQPPLILGVQEGSGSSGEADYSTTKYAPLASLLSKYLKRDVKVLGLSPSRQFSETELGAVDILFSRPASVSAYAMNKMGFIPVVSVLSGEPTKVIILGPASSKAILDAKGGKKLRFALPKEGDTHDVSLAVLAAKGIPESAITAHNVNLQATIPFALESGLVDAGAFKTDSTVAAKLKKENKFVELIRSDAIPPWAILLSKKNGVEMAEKLKVIVMSMDDGQHKADLDRLRITSFVDFNEGPYNGMYKLHNTSKK